MDENQKYAHYVFCQYLGTYTLFLKTHFFDMYVFLIENRIKFLKPQLSFFQKFTFIFLRNYQSSRKYYYWRPMPHRRPTCLIGDLLETYTPSDTNIPHLRPTFPNGDRHSPSETDMPVESNHNLNSYISKYTSACRSPIRECPFRRISNEACRGPRYSMSRSLMGLQSGKSVSDGSPMVLQ